MCWTGCEQENKVLEHCSAFQHGEVHLEASTDVQCDLKKWVSGSFFLFTFDQMMCALFMINMVLVLCDFPPRDGRLLVDDD